MVAASALLLAHALFMCVLGLPGVSAAAPPAQAQFAAEKSHGAPHHAQAPGAAHEQGCVMSVPPRTAEPTVTTIAVDLDVADAQSDPSPPWLAGWGPWRIAAPDGRAILRTHCIDRC